MVFGTMIFLAEIPLPAAQHEAAQVHLGIGGNHAQVAVEVAVGEDVPFLHQTRVFLEDAAGARDIGFAALEFERVVYQRGADVEPAFK